MSKNGIKHVMQTERCLFINHLDAQNKQIDSTKTLLSGYNLLCRSGFS